MFSLTPTFVEIETPETRSLLERALAGDAEAFGELCREHETRLIRQAMILCGNESLAEDLAQDTLMEAWKCLRRFNERCQFFTWLCAILSNRYCNTVRRKRPFAFSTLSRLDSEGFQTTVNNLADEHSSPDQAVLVREQAAVVRGCIEALPPKQRQVIVMRFFGDDSLEGIAAALDCSVGTVKSRLFHALEKLRAMNALSGRSQL